jgi:hypothetical protein
MRSAEICFRSSINFSGVIGFCPRLGTMTRSIKKTLIALCFAASFSCARADIFSEPSSSAVAAQHAQVINDQPTEKTQEHLETLDKLVTHLEQSVVIMLGVAALVITLIFGTTIIGEIRVIQAIKKLDSEAVEVKERFPKLSAMETQARIALKNIEVTFGIEGADTWLEDRYASLGIVERQRILTVEHLIALEFTGRSTPSQLRGMSNFYYSKFKFERLASDLDRSLYYAHLASDRGNEAFQYLNDLGFLYMELMEKDKRYREDAMRALLLSKGKHSKQQRCYYNIATLLFDEAIAKKAAGDAPSFYKMMSEIRQLLYTALLHPKWEIQASPELASLIHYNLACCLCGIVEQYLPLNTQHPLLDEALEHLQAASEFKQTKAETLVRDLDKQCGDLKALADNAFYAKRMHALRTAVEDRSA